jgi:hypothetical protein
MDLLISVGKSNFSPHSQLKMEEEYKIRRPAARPVKAGFLEVESYGSFDFLS